MSYCVQLQHIISIIYKSWHVDYSNLYINRLQTRLEVGLQTALNRLHILLGGDPRLTVLTTAREGKVLGHVTLLVDNVDTGALQLLGEADHVGGVVELATLHQTTGPGEDRGNGVGRGLTALLVLTEVTSHGTVGSLGLEGLGSGGDQARGHQAKRAEALSDNVGLDVTVVVYHVVSVAR